MATELASVFSLHERALELHNRRLELIASNLANADTPGFKARDIDFRQALSDALVSGRLGLATSSKGHISLGQGTNSSADVQYRNPTQPSLDGNTVDSNTEKTALAELSVRYESTLMLLTRKINGLREALRTQ